MPARPVKPQGDPTEECVSSTLDRWKELVHARGQDGASSRGTFNGPGRGGRPSTLQIDPIRGDPLLQTQLRSNSHSTTRGSNQSPSSLGKRRARTGQKSASAKESRLDVRSAGATERDDAQGRLSSPSNGTTALRRGWNGDEGLAREKAGAGKLSGIGDVSVHWGKQWCLTLLNLRGRRLTTQNQRLSE